MSLALTHRELRKPALAKINPKLAVALKAMIHEGKRIDQAAQIAGLTAHRIRQALSQAHVLAFCRAEKQVRLEGVRLSNITELERIRTGDGAAAVSAIKLLEEMAGDKAQAASTVAASTPGVTINIVNGLASVPGQVIEGQRVHVDAFDGSTPSDAGERSTTPPRPDDPV